MLQLSLDWMKLEEAVETVRELYHEIDVIEVGTPIIFEYGLSAVRKMKQMFPEKTVLADMKIIDAGGQEAEMAVQAGADIITVMGAANNLTIQNAAEIAHRAGKKIMVDLLGVREIEEKTRVLSELKVDYICVHTAFDMKTESDRPTAELDRVNRTITSGKTAIAGGITLKELEDVMKGNPELVIVGGGILNEADRKAAAKQFYEVCGGMKGGEA